MNHFFKNVPFTVLLFISIYLNSCNTTEPGEENITPGRRDYEWTVDTLYGNSPNYYLLKLWGFDINNVWLAGLGDTPFNLWNNVNGKWQPYRTKVYGSYVGIYGFSKTDIWIAGNNLMQHYNGSSWSSVNDILFPNTYSTIYSDLWGSNSSDIYAVGLSGDNEGNNFGIINHFNGTEWEFIDIPEERVIFSQVKQDINGTKYIYLAGTKFETTGDTEKIYMYNGKELIQLYSGTETTTVNQINGKVYLCIGNKIYKPKNNGLEIWKDFNWTKYLGRVWGRSEKDFFGVASDGLAHYNGTDLVTIYPTVSSIVDGFIFEKDIFIICDFRIIIHGKLKSD